MSQLARRMVCQRIHSGRAGHRASLVAVRGKGGKPNGKYIVCFMLDGKLTFRTVGYELDAARRERRAFVEAARWGVIASRPRLRFGQAAGWWVERFERRVAVGGRCERTLDVHVRAQLSRARGGTPCRRFRLKTRSARRQIPLSPQLAALLQHHRETSRFKAGSVWSISLATLTKLGDAIFDAFTMR